MNRLVGQTDGLAPNHRLCQFFLTGEMEISEEQLSLSYQLIFGFDGFLHLDNHLRLAIHSLDSGQDSGSSSDIIIIAEAAAVARSMLHTHLMAPSGQFCHTRRCHAHAVLIVLDFFWDSYFHKPMF